QYAGAGYSAERGGGDRGGRNEEDDDRLHLRLSDRDSDYGCFPLQGRKCNNKGGMSIRREIGSLRRSIPQEVKMVAVSKFHPAAMIQEAYAGGQRIFGESRVQELVSKQQQLPGDIEWHFIGGLQRNKVKQIAPFVSLIHSLDSERLMLEIEKQGAACERVIPCLLRSEERRVGRESWSRGARARCWVENAV